MWLDVGGRLAPGVTIDHARAQLEAIWPEVRATTAPPEFRGAQRDYFFAMAIDLGSLAHGQDWYLRRTFTKPLRVVLGVAGLILLVACINVANLMLVRAAERQKEIAIRLALGAGRWRIIRQLLSESILLSLVSGVTGLLIGVWMMEGLLKLAPEGMPRLNQTKLDTTVLLFTLGVSLLTGLLFGLLPAWQSARHDLHTSLKEQF